MNRGRWTLGALAAAACAMGRDAGAQVVTLGQFSPGLGQLASCGFDPANGRVWIYNSSGTVISSYTTAGAFVASVPRPGESANDVDIEIAPEAFTLGTTSIPAGTLLFINGESGTADIYALNNSTGAIIGSLATDFGVSHVVGGAYHPQRNTFFLVQDNVPAGAAANRVAEIDPVTGDVLNTFLTSPTFSVNFGDIDVNAGTGNLLLVSSAESTIAEFTPTGAFVQEFALPAGVTGLSGIGMDDATGEAWVSGTGGTVWRLGGLPTQCETGDVNCDGTVNVLDLLAVINAWGPCAAPCPPRCAADIAPVGPPIGNCSVDVLDLLLVINNWS